jgi:hypothetical protein
MALAKYRMHIFLLPQGLGCLISLAGLVDVLANVRLLWEYFGCYGLILQFLGMSCGL